MAKKILVISLYLDNFKPVLLRTSDSPPKNSKQWLTATEIANELYGYFIYYINITKRSFCV